MRIAIYTLLSYSYSYKLYYLLHKYVYPNFLLSLLIISCSTFNATETLLNFDEKKAFNHVKNQLEFGPRTPGSEGHARAREYIYQNLSQSGWVVETQESTIEGHEINNIIGKTGAGRPLVILGAHYDTRLFSDRDPFPKNISTPVPGANDGASGVAVLLELARILPHSFKINGELGSGDINQVWLVFFDAEDNGGIPGWDWILGSKALAETLNITPDAVVIIDMIGDANLKIYQEKNSDPVLSQEIWQVAEKLGYKDSFIPLSKYRILDDHVPFLELGIPAVDIIDIEYAYYHTTADTLDKISPESLKIVGDTVLDWILNKQFSQN